MKPLTLIQPPRMALGPGCREACPAWFAERGSSRVFAISSPETAGHANSLLSALVSRAAGLFQDIRQEPTISLFHTVLAAARDARADAIVGVGGGSVLDVAKLVAAFLGGSQRLDDVFGIGLLAPRTTPVVCLPTTSGTGSEVSPNSLLLDENTFQKKAIVSPYLVPDAAFVDAELTVSMPPGVTAATGMDALSHCVESYTNVHAHPAVDVYALEGIRLASASLAAAWKDGTDMAARDGMARASFYGGLCLGPVNTAAAHALAYPLGAEYHVPHGLSIAVLLPSVMEFNIPAATERYARIASALGAESGKSIQETAANGVARVRAISHQIGTDRPLSSFGVSAADIPRLAKAGLLVTRLLVNNPRPLAQADAEGIYRSAL